MAPTLHFTDVVTALSSLVVANLTVCDLDDIPNAVDTRGSYLVPSPIDPPPVSGFRLERVSFGMDTAKMDAFYTVNYKLMYMPVGAGRGLMDVYPGMMAMAAAVMEAVLALSALNGAADWTPRIDQIAPVTDPAGNQWHAVMLSIDIRDFVQ